MAPASVAAMFSVVSPGSGPWSARLRRRLALLAATVALVAAACGPDGEGDEDTAEEVAEEAVPVEETVPVEEQATTITAAPAEQDIDADAAEEPVDDPAGNADDRPLDERFDLSGVPEVTVLEPGAEPRVELRLEIPDGLSEVMVATQGQSIVQVFDGESGPDLGATVTEITTDLTAEEVDDLLEIASIVSDAVVVDAPDAQARTLTEAGLASVVGVETITVLDERGRALDIEVLNLDALDPALAAEIEQTGTSDQLQVPLPEEAVGVGATWEVVQQIPAAGLELEQVLVYELVAVDLPIIELKVTGTQSVPAGAVLEAQGTEATVVSWQLDIDGTMTQDLSTMVPTSSVDVFGTQVFDFDGLELEQTIETSSSIAPG